MLHSKMVAYKAVNHLRQKPPDNHLPSNNQLVEFIQQTIKRQQTYSNNNNNNNNNNKNNNNNNSQNLKQ